MVSPPTHPHDEAREAKALERIAVALEHIRAMIEVLGPEIVKIANPPMTVREDGTIQRLPTARRGKKSF